MTRLPTLPLMDTFDLLCQESGVRNPLLHRENRGLCPAHQDRHNPALVFTVNEDETKLLVHCFARECGLEQIAESLGISPASFFVGSIQPKGQIKPRPPRWKYLPLTNLLQLLPITRHFDDEVEAIFKVMEGMDYPFDQRLRDLPFVEVESALWAYLESEFDPDKHNWHTVRDEAYRRLRQYDLDNRTNPELETA